MMIILQNPQVQAVLCNLAALAVLAAAGAGALALKRLASLLAAKLRQAGMAELASIAEGAFWQAEATPGLNGAAKEAKALKMMADILGSLDVNKNSIARGIFSRLAQQLKDGVTR